VIGGKLASSPTATDGGHLHILLDGAVTSNMTPTTTPKVQGLEPGDHELAVEFVGPDHISFQPKVIDRIEITAE
jgi:hypothetical protein